MAPLTIRAQLERWIIEEEVGDGTYRRVPLIEYVNRWIAEARADALREAAERVRALRDDTDVLGPDWNAALAAVLTYLEPEP